MDDTAKNPFSHVSGRQLATLRFDLLKPMRTSSWIDQVLLAWVKDIVTAFPDDAEEACDCLHQELGKRFHRQSSLCGLRQQVKHHMSVDPGMIGALVHIKRQTGAISTKGFFHLKVSAENSLMSRNSEDNWEPAKCSDYPISAELSSNLTPGAIGTPPCPGRPESAELTIRLRLELPPQFAVYIWDEGQNRDRLLRVD